MPQSQVFSNCRQWPSISDYNQFKPQNVSSWIGHPIQFILQKKERKRGNGLGTLYEPLIFLSGQVRTRPENWHDFFNALIWYTFPKSKAALNMRQFIAYDENADFPWTMPQKHRIPEQDRMTMFDEGGCIMIHSGDQKTPWLFGHAFYERIFYKDSDLSAYTLDITMPGHFLALSRQEQIDIIDSTLSHTLAMRETYGKSSRFYTHQIL